MTTCFIFQTKTTLQISAFSYQGAGFPDIWQRKKSQLQAKFSSFILCNSPKASEQQNWQQFIPGGCGSWLFLWCRVAPPCVGHKEGSSKPKATNDSMLSTYFPPVSPAQICSGQHSEWPSTRTLLRPVCPQLHDDLGTVDHPGLDPTSTEPCLLLLVRVLLVKEQRHLASFPFRSPPGKPLGIKREQVKWVFERLQVRERYFIRWQNTIGLTFMAALFYPKQGMFGNILSVKFA